MKKILLSLIIIAVIGFTAKVQGQSCNLNTPFIKFTSGTGIAPFSIGESPNAIADWETYILGPGTGNAITPFNPPASSGANWSKDGVDGVDDLDSPQSPRDLRFFSFTYDNYNVYFYFRRINNSNAQNTFYYILDINADGFMNTGEPVIRANFNSGAVTNFGIYNFITSGTDFVSGKGNYMVSPTTGFADGYSVQGSVLSTPVALPALNPNEKFEAAITESGFGVEFAVPWRFLKNWQFSGAPLTPGDVFTYHVSTQNGTGTYTLTNASDNAGGCCSGLASIGDAKYVIKSITTNPVVPNLQYTASITLENTGNAPAKVSFDNIEINNIVQFAGRPIDENDFVVKAYIDANGNGVLDGTEATTLKTFTYSGGTFASQPIIYSSPTPRDTVSLAPSGGLGYFLLDIRFPVNYSVKSAKLIINTTGVLNLPLGPCQQSGVPQQAPADVPITTTLPVDFKSFTATRNRSNVMLKWETSTEKNNNGFAIERNIDNATWQQVGFVPTQAVGGNSNLDLSYQFIDQNNVKGISQYRIRQVDIDSRSKFSEVRSVKGDGQIGTVIVYPNPSANGKVNVVFDNATVVRDITVMDMSGRTIKSIRGVTNNNITIDNLQPGMYSLRIFVAETGEQVVQKIVVNQR